MESQLMQENKELTISEKIIYSTKEIAKIIRQELNKKYPDCTFSVVKESNAINVYLMKANFKVIADFADIPEEALMRKEQDRYTAEQIKAIQAKKYHQLNQFQVLGDYKPSEWCNGVFLTEEGHNMFKEVVKISNVYNWDNSDAQIDYFDVHFYLSIGIGKWDKDFEEVLE